MITTIDITDRKNSLKAFKNNNKTISEVQSVLVDGGYTGQPFANETKPLFQG